MSSPARIRFTCIHCNKKLSVLPAAGGRTLPCPNPQCGEPITVPPPDAIEAANPASPAASANVPTGATPLATASRPGAMVMTAAALSILSLGFGLSFFLIKPYGIPKKAHTPVKALANAAHDQKAAVKAAPETEATTSPSNSPESQRKLAAAKQKKSKAAQKEQAARKERDKLLAEYAVLARVQSFEYYHNDRRVIPRWHRPPSEVTTDRPLSLPKYDDDLPRIRPLVRSGNENIRNVAASILKSYELAENYRNDAAVSVDNVMAEYRKGVTSFENHDAMQERRALMLGQPARTEGKVFAANMGRAFAVASSFQRQRQANQSYQTALRELAQDQMRISCKLAKELACPQPDTPVGIQLNVEAFVPGEDVFRSGEPFANARYCITVANEEKKLTHCSIAVIVRLMVARRSADGARPDLGPPFGLDEFTEPVLQPEASRSYQDSVVLYYIGELNTHDRVHFLDLQGWNVRDNLERIGVVLFSDQMTVVGDPNPGFQEVRDNHLSQAGSNVENQRTPQNEAPSQRMPTSRRPAGPQSSKRSKANGAPQRK